MSLADNITIQSYDDTADAYIEKTLLIDTSRQIEKFLSYIPKRGLILDSGCGPGRDCKKFTDARFRVVGVDLSRKLLNYAITYAPKAGFLKMDLNDLKFPDNYFDGVWAMASLLHLPKADFPRALEEHYRVMKPEAPFYISLKRGDGEKLESDARYGGVQKYFAYYKDDELLKILKNTQFKILDFQTVTIESAYATHPWMDIYLQK